MLFCMLHSKNSHVTCPPLFRLTVNPASCFRRGLVVPLSASRSRTTATLASPTRCSLPLNLICSVYIKDLQRITKSNMEKSKAFDKMSILFDFDGTIGDTETPAMEVAFWELAPYLVDTGESSYSLGSSVSGVTAARILSRLSVSVKTGSTQCTIKHTIVIESGQSGWVRNVKQLDFAHLSALGLSAVQEKHQLSADFTSRLPHTHTCVAQ